MSKNGNQDSFAAIFSAVRSSIVDFFDERGKLTMSQDRIDGKTCLITGANSGLGKAIAIQLAQRGGHLLLACRSGIPDAGEEIKKLSGSNKIEMLAVDLADFQSIHKLCDELNNRKVKLDIVVLNAGLVTFQAQQTSQGFESMFGVNYLANMVLVNRLLKDNIIPITSDSRFVDRANSLLNKDRSPPRIIFTSSEAHRFINAIDFETLGHYRSHSMAEVNGLYSYSKLLLTTFFLELNRRLNSTSEVNVSVHALCPGPVNSRFAQNGPLWSKVVMKIMMTLFFKDPNKACAPAVHLACDKDIENKSGLYLHLMKMKKVSDTAAQPEIGQRLWQASEALIANAIVKLS